MSDNGQPAGPQWLRSALERYERPLLRYAAGLTGDVETARDVVQETFTRLCRQDRAAVDGHVAPWLYTVCRRRALTVRRKEKRMRVVAEPIADSRESPDPAPAVVAESRETTGRVLRFLETLPAKQREVVRLKFQHGLRYKEIAEVMSISVSNVGFLIHTAIKTLRARMGDT